MSLSSWTCLRTGVADSIGGGTQASLGSAVDTHTGSSPCPRARTLPARGLSS